MKLRVNGREHEVAAPPDMPLLWVLRDVLGLTGTKFGCGMAQCGACTVHLDGRALRSCVLPVARGRRAPDHDDRGPRPDGRASGAAGLGRSSTSCSAATASRARSWPRRRLLAEVPQPTDADIDAALSANLCRCGTYQRIRAAVHRAAELAGPGERS